MKSKFSIIYDDCFLCPQKPLPTPSHGNIFLYALLQALSFLILRLCPWCTSHGLWCPVWGRGRDLPFPSGFQVVSAKTVEKSSIPNEDALASLFKIQWSFKCGSVSWVLHSVPLIYFLIFLPVLSWWL